MRDITKSVQGSAAMPGNRTNPAERGKSHKPNDRIASHLSDRTFAVSDTNVYLDGKPIAVERSNAPHIVRNADGTTNVADTLAVATLLRMKRASQKGKHA